MALHARLRSLYRALPLPRGLGRRARDWYEARCRRSHAAFFLAHPNVGSTMITMAVGRYLQLQAGAPRFRFLHDIYWTTDHTPGRTVFPPFGKVSSTHLPRRMWTPASEITDATCIEPYAHAKIVLLIRDPLHALLSAWLHHVSHGLAPALIDVPLGEGCFDSIVLEPHGLPASLAYYNAFARNRESLDLLMVRYEDCKAGPEALPARLTEILDFLSGGEHAVDRELLDQGIHYSSMEGIAATKGTGELADDAGVDMAESYNTLAGDLPHQTAGFKGPYADFYLGAEARARARAYQDAHLDPWYGYGPPEGDEAA